MKRSEIAIYNETVPVSNEIGKIIQVFALAMPRPTNQTAEILTSPSTIYSAAQVNNLLVDLGACY